MDRFKNDQLLSKGERTQRKIIEATIASIVKHGFEGTTVSTICSIGKINRGLIVHYFATVDKLVDLATRTVLDWAIESTVRSMNTRTDVADPVSRYFVATFDWMRERPTYGQFVTMLFTRGGTDKRSRQVGQFVFESGRGRVEQILKDDLKDRKLPPKKIKDLAAEVHCLLVGSLMAFFISPSEIDIILNRACQGATALLKGSS